MRRATSTFALILFALTLAFGCGGNSDPVEPSGPELEGTTLSVSESTSLGKVYLLGLPNPKAPEDYEVRVFADGEEQGSLLVESDENGPFFHAPLHPLTPNEGGAVTIQLMRGESLGSELGLDLLALPEAPGAFEKVVTALRAHVEQRAGWAGTSIEELASLSFAEVDPLLFPLKVAQNYVDSDEEGSLTGLVANEAGFLSAEERELLDRLYGYAPINDLIEAEVDSFAGGRPPALILSPTQRRTDLSKACIDLGPPISTASQLSDAMLASALADVAINPNSAPGRTLDALGTILVGGSVLPVYGKMFSSIGAGVAGWETSADFLRSIFPNRLTHLSFDYDKPEFNEDDDGFGEWSNVRVIAASDGWSATAQVADIITKRLGAGITVPRVNAMQELEFLKSAGMAGFNAALQNHLEAEGGIELCPRTWDVDITEHPYSTGGVLDQKFTVNAELRQVRPAIVGDDILRVAAQPSEFGGREIHEDLAIKTKPILVNVLPDDITVEAPGDIVQLTATIQNAEITTLSWEAQNGTWMDTLGGETDDGATRPLKTPLEPSAYPFLVIIESESDQGIRASGIPARLDIATIRFEDPVGIQIEPPYACIQPGETQQFEAIVTGLEEYNVTWRIDEGWGTIDQNGLYQSLSGGTSNAVISAQIDEAEEHVATADVDAAACNCSLDIEITGDSNWSKESSQAAFTVVSLGDLFYQFFFDLEHTGSQSISASIGGIDESPSPRPGDTGSWKCSFVVISGEQSWVSVWEDQPIPGVSVNITEFTETYMVGSFTGNAVQLGEDNEITSIVGVDVQFRAGYWDGGGWPCN